MFFVRARVEAGGSLSGQTCLASAGPLSEIESSLVAFPRCRADRLRVSLKEEWRARGYSGFTDPVGIEKQTETLVHTGWRSGTILYFLALPTSGDWGFEADGVSVLTHGIMLERSR